MRYGARNADLIFVRDSLVSPRLIGRGGAGVGSRRLDRLEATAAAGFLHRFG